MLLIPQNKPGLRAGSLLSAHHMLRCRYLPWEWERKVKMTVKSNSFGTARRPAGTKFRTGDLGRALDSVYKSTEAGFVAVEASSRVIWKPFADPGVGYVVEWADAVAAVNLVEGPTEIQIVVPEQYFAVTIPGGTWELNQTTLVGPVSGKNEDDNSGFRRGYPDRLDLDTVSFSDAPGNPTWLKGCVGFRGINFWGTDWDAHHIHGATGTFTAKVGCVVTFTTAGYAFSAKDVGKPIRIGDWDGNIYTSYGAANETPNNGTFKIKAVLDANTIQFDNASGVVADGNNGSIGWSLCTAPLIHTEWSGPNTVFTLDDAAIHYDGNCNWGIVWVEECRPLFVQLQNTGEIRWKSLWTDGNVLAVGDGTSTWISNDAFVGLGSATVNAATGMQVGAVQCRIGTYDLYQTYVAYVPAADWSGWSVGGDVPTNIAQALDILAAKFASLA